MPNRISTAFRQLGVRVFIKGGLTVLALIAVGLLANRIDFEQFLQGMQFSGEPDEAWFRGPAGFLVVATAMTTVGAPRQIVSFFAAYFFGLWWGVGLALAATAIGCVASYCFAMVFRQSVRRFIRGKIDMAIQFWAANTFSTTLILRLLPVGSNLISNLAAGVTGISLLPFLAGSVLGYIPQTVVFAMMGSGVNVGSQTRIVTSIVLFAISAVIGLALYARYRKTIQTGK